MRGKLWFSAAVAGVALSLQAYAADRAAPPLATPPGVTLQPIRGGMIYADVHGMSLYTFEKDQAGKSVCTGDCAVAWRPVIAPGDAKGGGDWSLALRDDGVRQWAFKGKPLYSSTKDANPSDTKGVAEGWKVAAFQPTLPASLPPDVSVREAIALPGQVLASAAGLTLYTGPLDCTAKCLDIWQPVAAPGIAGTIGDFVAVKRRDGMRQWAYKGAALYTFTGDIEPGVSSGVNADARFQVATMTQYFTPAAAAIRANADDPIHPAILTAADGRTLYARERYTYTQTFHAKDGDRGTVAHGRAIGTKGCTGECLAQWRPLAAPGDAVASGHWTIYTRDDGSRQWAYQGFALYTYAADEKPGDIRGNELFDEWEKDIIGLKPGSATATASVMFWRVAAP